MWIEWLKTGFMRTVSAVNRPFFLVLYRQKSPAVYVSDWLKVSCGSRFSSLVSCTVNKRPDKYRLMTFSPRPRTREKAKKSCTSWFFFDLHAVSWFTCNSSDLWQMGLVSSPFLPHSLFLVLKCYYYKIKPNYSYGIKEFRIILLTEVRNQSDFWMLKGLHELPTVRFCSCMM